MASYAMGLCVRISDHWRAAALVLLGCGTDTDALFSEPESVPPPETRAFPNVPAGFQPLPSLESPPSALTPAAMAPPAQPPPSTPPVAVPSPPASSPSPVVPSPAVPSEICAAFGPFGAPEPITGLGLAVDTQGPAFSADGLTLFFSAIDGDENILSAVRTGADAQFAPAVVVPNLDADGSEEGTPFLSFDGASLYFFSTRPGPLVQGGRDI